MANPGRYVPVQVLDDAITNTKGYPDPRGSDAIMHYMKIWQNNKPYNLEVLHHRGTNTILHYKYTRKKIGPLNAIE